LTAFAESVAGLERAFFNAYDHFFPKPPQWRQCIIQILDLDRAKRAHATIGDLTQQSDTISSGKDGFAEAYLANPEILGVYQQSARGLGKVVDECPRLDNSDSDRAALIGCIGDHVLVSDRVVKELKAVAQEDILSDQVPSLTRRKWAAVQGVSSYARQTRRTRLIKDW